MELVLSNCVFSFQGKFYQQLQRAVFGSPVSPVIANIYTGNPETNVIVTYSPTNVATDEDIQQYNESLRRAIESVPAHNFLIILDSFNAQLGLDDARYTMHTTSNRNGKLLHELAIENTSFQKSLGKLWTYISPGGYKSQIDYIIIRKKWKKFTSQCRTIQQLLQHWLRSQNHVCKDKTKPPSKW